MLILEILKCGGSSPPCPKNVGAWSIKMGTCTSAKEGLISEAKYTGVRYHFYADDTQLFIHLSPDDSLKSFDRLKSCLNDIQVWMSENKLKLNPDKTEFIVFGAKDRHKWLSDSLSISWVIASLPQMLYAIWVFCLIQSFVSPIT